MTDDDQNSILAEVYISNARKFLLVAALFGLGVVVLGLSWTSEASFVGRAVLFLMGGFFVLQGERIRRTPQISLQLKADGLFQSDGVAIAKTDHIKSIDRGALALKPSNGFILKLTEKHPRGWVPGLWWRFGKMVGVGGIANAGAAKFMAEQIAIRIKPNS